MQVTYTQAKGYHVIDIPEGMKLMFLGKLDDNLSSSLLRRIFFHRTLEILLNLMRVQWLPLD